MRSGADPHRETQPNGAKPKDGLPLPHPSPTPLTADGAFLGRARTPLCETGTSRLCAAIESREVPRIVVTPAHRVANAKHQVNSKFLGAQLHRVRSLPKRASSGANPALVESAYLLTCCPVDSVIPPRTTTTLRGEMSASFSKRE